MRTVTTDIHTDVTSDDLNGIVEFGTPFTAVTGNVGVHVITRPDLWAPETWLDMAEPHDLGHDGAWEPVHGYSGAHEAGASAVMHPSEFLGGRMAEDVLTAPGTYVVVEVTDFDSGDEPPVGWALLRHVRPEDSSLV